VEDRSCGFPVDAAMNHDAGRAVCVLGLPGHRSNAIGEPVSRANATFPRTMAADANRANTTN